MNLIVWFVAGLVIGAVAGMLIFRNNAKKIEGQIADLQSIVEKLKKK